nr:hypothetical protein [Micromonospora sp. DSM 115978]
MNPTPQAPASLDRHRRARELDALAGGATVDLLVVGGPTHVHSMSRPTTRQSAGDMVRKQPESLVLEPGAEGAGLREWFDSLGTVDALAAAFDTRVGGPPIFVGQASKAVDRLLRRHGADVVLPPQSFLVTKDNELAPGALDHARE